MPPAAPTPVGSVDFGRSFSFVTEDPEWIKKILIGGAFTLACALLVGVPFVLGYFSRALRNVVAGEPRPMPEWDDLGGIFNEGLRLTAVYLLYTLAIVAVLAALGAVVILPVIALSGRGDGPSEVLGVLGGLGVVAAYGFVMLASWPWPSTCRPRWLRAALRGRWQTASRGARSSPSFGRTSATTSSRSSSTCSRPSWPSSASSSAAWGSSRGLLGLHGAGRGPGPDRAPEPGADLTSARA
jgi:hypothetical protein